MLTLECADLSNMCAQTIFTLLDHLHTWAVGKNRAAAIRRMKNQTQRGMLCNYIRTYVCTLVCCLIDMVLDRYGA